MSVTSDPGVMASLGLRHAPRNLRIPFVRRCLVHDGEHKRSAFLLDLSLSGVFVKMDELPKAGQPLKLSFQVPGNDRWLELKGVVVWLHRKQTHPVHGLPPGFGFRFAPLARQDAMLIADTITAYCRSNPIYRQYL